MDSVLVVVFFSHSFLLMSASGIVSRRAKNCRLHSDQLCEIEPEQVAARTFQGPEQDLGSSVETVIVFERFLSPDG